MSDSNGWITAEDLAGFLKLPVTSIWRLARTGKIPHGRAGRLMRFRLDEVEQALRVPAVDQSNKSRTEDGETVD